LNIDVDEVIAKLDPRIRKGLSTGEGIVIDKQSTPSYGLNRALDGGLPYGRQVLIWGSKSSAKSSLCLQTIALAQAEGKLCAWVDAEMSYSEDWARRLGVDPSKLIYSQARTINEMVDVTIALMEAGVDIVVIDSITSLLPAVYFEKDSTELKALENTKQIGAESRDLSHAWKMINYANNREKPTLLLLISQARNSITPMFTQPIPTGGHSTKFYSSTIIKLFSSESDNQTIKGKIAVGDKLIEERVGRKIRWELQNSKTSAPFASGEYDFYFKGDFVGIDAIGDIVDTAEMLGVISRTGAWYQLEDGTKIQGRDAFVERVREDEVLQASIKEKILNV
jgi:recombination protein RecA